jgi:hypothetical protein
MRVYATGKAAGEAGPTAPHCYAAGRFRAP